MEPVYLSLYASLAFLGLAVFQWFRISLKLKMAEQQSSFLTRDLEQNRGLVQVQHLELQTAQQNLQQLQARLVQSETELRLHKDESQRRLETYRDAEQRMGQTFQALSNESLRQNGDSFLVLARSVLEQHEVRAQGDMNLRQQAVHSLVEPIQRSLHQVQERIQDLEKQRQGAYQGLQEQIGLLLEAQTKMQLEATNLATAMRSPTARGRWGELQLRRVVEMAGMLAYCDFYEQNTLHSEKGVQRPDMIVRLPGQRSIAVDAKVPLHYYLEAIDCNDENRRAELFFQHAQLVRKQVQQLGQKSYWEQLEGSPDFVLLFLPGESFFSAALQADPSLLEIGVDHKVLITTPVSLIALLRTSASVWRQEDVARNAQEVGRLGKELYQRMADLNAHVSEMGRHMGSCVQAYNRMVGTIESRVMVSARRFQELKVDDLKKDLKELTPVEHYPRNLQLAELDL